MTTTNTTNARPHTADVEQSLTDLVGLGRLWARYGLEAGSRALTASSQSLAVTSELLRNLSAAIDPEPPAPSAEPPTASAQSKANDDVIDVTA